MSATADRGANCDLPQFAEDTVEVVRFAPRERVQQGTTEQIVDEPQFAKETVPSKWWRCSMEGKRLMHCVLRNQGSCARSKIALRRVEGSIRASF